MAVALADVYSLDLQSCTTTNQLAMVCYEHIVSNKLPHGKLASVSRETRYADLPADGKIAHHTPRWIGSDAFLASYEWRKIRYEALATNNGCCELCGQSKADGRVLHVDHIKPRRKYPELALVLSNLQVLCEECNHGKGNWDETDWRKRA